MAVTLDNETVARIARRYKAALYSRPDVDQTFLGGRQLDMACVFARDFGYSWDEFGFNGFKAMNDPSIDPNVNSVQIAFAVGADYVDRIRNGQSISAQDEGAVKVKSFSSIAESDAYIEGLKDGLPGDPDLSVHVIETRTREATDGAPYLDALREDPDQTFEIWHNAICEAENNHDTPSL